MRYFTAGESHGPRLTAIVEGVPAGLPLTADYINAELNGDKEVMVVAAV